MKTLARSLLLVTCLGGLLTSDSLAASAAAIQKTVLLLFPYQQDLPMHVLARRALGEELDNARDLTLNVYCEYLDLNRFPDPALQQRLFALYAAKYRAQPIDLVIVQTEVMYSIEAQARQAARIGLRILRGEAAESIPDTQNPSDRYIFDHVALQRFDLPLSALPPDSIIKNRQYSFRELHRTQIIATLTGMAALLLLVFFLLEVTRRLNRTRRALADVNVNLETQVQERTAALRQTNARLQDEITERRQAEAALVQSTQARLEQQARLVTMEEERKYATRQQRLIRDLHDGLGAINANIGLLAARADREADPVAREQLLATIGRLAAAGGLEVRELMNTLEARDMPWGNLIHDLRRYATLVLDAAGLQWELVVTGDLPRGGPGPLAGFSLLRIFREAINNTLKHAQARSLRLQIEFAAGRCRIGIQDDGQGFPAATPRTGRGLRNMRQRIGELGGTMQVQAESGTRLCFDLPVPVALVEPEP